MKIISSYKDYYDYLQGIYGIDELRVLDRSRYMPTPLFFEGDRASFAICDQYVEGIYLEGSWRYGEAIRRYSHSESERGFQVRIVTQGAISKSSIVPVNKYPHPFKDSPNRALDCPILIRDKYSTWTNSYDINWNPFPILKNYNVGSVYDPVTLWTMLSNWLGRDRTVNVRQTDKEKIVSHGFDPKTSFRKM